MICLVMEVCKGGLHQLFGQGLLMERYGTVTSAANVYNDCHNNDPCLHFCVDLNCGTGMGYT